MGMFDTVHANETSYQTKAFGKMLRDFSLGDRVELMMAPFTLEEYEEWGPGEIRVEAPEAYQVKCLGEDAPHYQWIMVKQGVLIAVGEREEDLPGFDYYGHPLPGHDG